MANLRNTSTMANCLMIYKLNRWETPAHMKVFGAILFTYCPMIITINAFLISSIIATNQSLENTSNLLIVCLSGSDIAFGAIVLPLIATDHFWYNEPNVCALKTTSVVLQCFFYTNSTGITMLLATDRYLHMNPDFHQSPSRLAKFFKRPRIFVLLLTVSLMSAALAIELHFCMMNGLNLHIYNTLFCAVLTLISITLIVGLYTRGYMRIRRFVAENPVYANREPNEESPEYLKQLFKTVLLLLIALTFSSLPALISSGWLAMAYFTSSSYPPSGSALLYEIMLLLLYTNGVTNAVIIFYRNKKSWKWMKNQLSRFCCRQQRNQEGGPDLSVVVSNVTTTGV